MRKLADINRELQEAQEKLHKILEEKNVPSWSWHSSHPNSVWPSNFTV
jgi:hypothetical protein